MFVCSSLFKFDNRAFCDLVLPPRLERAKLPRFDPVVYGPEMYAIPIRNILHAKNPFQRRPSFQNFLAIRVALCYIMFNT